MKIYNKILHLTTTVGHLGVLCVNWALKGKLSLTYQNLQPWQKIVAKTHFLD